MYAKAFRVLLLAALVLVAAESAVGASAVAGPSSARRVSTAASLEPAILVELNAVRRAHGLRPLRRSTSLGAAAATHSRSMATHGFFRHESRDGSAFWRRVQQFYGKGGYASWAVGENLLWSTRVDGATAVRLWMESPGHRRNILDPRWREIGLAAVAVTRARGHFGGRNVVIVTSNFGVRA